MVTLGKCLQMVGFPHLSLYKYINIHEIKSRVYVYIYIYVFIYFYVYLSKFVHYRYPINCYCVKVVYLECTSQRALESGTHCSCKRRLPRCQRLDENRNRQLSMDYYGVIQYIYSLHGIISYKPMTTIYHR